MQIKFCGLSRTIDIEYVNELKPEMIGFVFYPKSKRFVSDETAMLLKKSLDPSIKSVGVFVDEPMDHIIKLCNDGVLDLVQLHGHEDEEYFKSLKTKIKQPVIQALTISSKDDFKRLNTVCDYYLLDNKVFGSGQSFDWSIIPVLDKPYIIAGGINIDNVDEALKLDAFAIDMSSSVETDGKKDYYKMRDIIKRVRG